MKILPLLAVASVRAKFDIPDFEFPEQVDVTELDIESDTYIRQYGKIIHDNDPRVARKGFSNSETWMMKAECLSHFDFVWGKWSVENPIYSYVVENEPGYDAFKMGDVEVINGKKQGRIYPIVEFDREEKDVYHLTIKSLDASGSKLSLI